MARTRAVPHLLHLAGRRLAQARPDAQRVYLMLVSQPKLTLAGCLDYMPSRGPPSPPTMTCRWSGRGRARAGPLRGRRL
jgi:hypothetical protein